MIEVFDSFCHPELLPAGRQGVSGSQSSRDSDLRQNDTKLVLVGREDYFYKRLEEKVKKMNLQESVLFYGEVSDEELSDLYKNALALVVPSFMEGFGLPVLEAMANKCLVLASDIPSLKEICQDSAIYFDPNDINDMVNKMEAVFSSDNHHGDKIKEGFERAKIFSWEKMAKETLDIYKECLSTTTPRMVAG